MASYTKSKMKYDKKYNKTHKRTSFVVTNRTKEAIDARAKSLNISVSEYVKKLIEKDLQENVIE